MGLSRRAVLLSGAVLLGGGTLGWVKLRPKGYAHLGRVALKRVYGSAAVGMAGEAFLADAEAFLRRETKLETPLTLYFMDAAYGLKPGYDALDWIAAFMVHSFAMSSTVIAATETGVPVEYTGFFDPHSAPCSNQLSVFNAPD